MRKQIVKLLRGRITERDEDEEALKKYKEKEKVKVAEKKGEEEQPIFLQPTGWDSAL